MNISHNLDFLQKIVGYQSANLGIALVVKAELDKEGNYAPTLKQLLDRKKFNNQIKEDLNYFIKQLRTSSLSVYDLNPNNLVYSYNPVQKCDHFVLIDGTGDKTFIPIQRLFYPAKWYAQKKYTSKLQKLIDSN
jgi:hypothetical protein